MKRHLHAVAEQSSSPKDVTMLLRVDILSRDWSQCHVEADRRQPVFVGDRRKRTWLR